MQNKLLYAIRLFEEIEREREREREREKDKEGKRGRKKKLRKKRLFAGSYDRSLFRDEGRSIDGRLAYKPAGYSQSERYRCLPLIHVHHLFLASSFPTGAVITSHLSSPKFSKL